MLEVSLGPGERAPRLGDAALPKRRKGAVLARCIATGIDGTDEGLLGQSDLALPRGATRLVMGHEACGEVLAADPGGPPVGSLIVPLVRLGCGRCAACLRGRADMCKTGDYVEAGIRGRAGFMRERWTAPTSSVVVAPKGLGWKAALVEPVSIAAKALREARNVQRRIPWNDGPRRALVCGSGSLGSMAALLLRTQGIDTVVYDRHGADHPGARFAQGVGARHADSRDPDALASLEPFDLILETTSVARVLVDVLPALAPDGVAVLLGVPTHSGPPEPIEPAARRLVLENQAIVGSVNSSTIHFRQALRALTLAERRWPGHLDATVACYAPSRTVEAFAERGPVKKVIVWHGGATGRGPRNAS